MLFLPFLFMAFASFCVFVFAMKSTPEQKALEKRLTSMKSIPGQIAGDGSGSLLLETENDSFAWVGVLAERFKFAETMHALLLQSESSMTLGKLMIASGVSAAVCGLLAFLICRGSLLIGAVALVQGSFYPVLFLRWKRSRKLNAFNSNLADAIDMMTRSLRAGHSVVAAIGIVAEQGVDPVKSEFAEVFKKQNYGLPIRDCLLQMLERVPSADLRVLVTGMLVQKETGGNLTEILDRITFTIRERVRIHGEIRTHTAQGRMTGWILCALPIVLLFILNLIDPGYSTVLFATPTGHKFMWGGAILLGLGGFSIRAIINGIEV